MMMMNVVVDDEGRVARIRRKEKKERERLRCTSLFNPFPFLVCQILYDSALLFQPKTRLFAITHLCLFFHPIQYAREKRPFASLFYILSRFEMHTNKYISLKETKVH